MVNLWCNVKSWQFIAAEMKAAGILPSAQTILNNVLADGLQEWNLL